MDFCFRKNLIVYCLLDNFLDNFNFIVLKNCFIFFIIIVGEMLFFKSKYGRVYIIKLIFFNLEKIY